MWVWTSTAVCFFTYSLQFNIFILWDPTLSEYTVLQKDCPEEFILNARDPQLKKKKKSFNFLFHKENN